MSNSTRIGSDFINGQSGGSSSSNEHQTLGVVQSRSSSSRVSNSTTEKQDKNASQPIDRRQLEWFFSPYKERSEGLEAFNYNPFRFGLLDN